MNRDFNQFLITGTIGDYIAIQSFLPKMDIKKVYIASTEFENISKLLKLIYPDVEITSLYEDWTKRFNFHWKSELSKLPNLPEDWAEVKDLGIGVFFKEIRKYWWRYEGFPLWEKTIDFPFELPEKFITVVFATRNGYRSKNRNFNEEDWQYLIQYLEKNDIFGVILQESAYDLVVPEHPKLINLIGQTNFLQTMGIMKKASGYIGIDSCLCVLAAQLLYPIFFVKSNNGHFFYNGSIYCAPIPPLAKGSIKELLESK